MAHRMGDGGIKMKYMTTQSQIQLSHDSIYEPGWYREEHNNLFIYFIKYNRQRTRRSLTCHTAMSQCLTQKEPVIYTNKLIKKTTDTKLAVNKKI